jgi:CubicO group peptidase (beta-lactamase class C family)
MALLGQALAVKAGKPYDQLVTERILRPLGMSDTVVQVPGSQVDGLADGSTATGHRTEAWSGEGYAPAGIGPRSTAADMARFVAGTLAGTAPGADATRPRFEEDGDGRIGYAWFTDRYGDREITWHNGATGGFKSYVAFDRSTQQGVVVLSNTDRSVEWVGLRLLGAEPPAGYSSASPGLARIAATVILLVWAAGSLLLLACTPIGRDRTWWRSNPDRLRFLTTTLSTIAVLLLAHLIGAWLQVPPVLWAVAAGLAATGAAWLVLRWGELPTIADGKPKARWSQTAVSAAVSVLVIVALSV